MVAFSDGTRLLHIGPHKTGTTTVQAAFWTNRDALPGHGVLYAGQTGHPMAAAMAAAQGRGLATATVGTGDDRWQLLVEEVEESDARLTVISSEFFSEASPERIRDIVDALGPDRVQVVVTLRPIARILASQWQQYMQNRPGVKYDDRLDYEDWLRAILDRPDSGEVTPSFWRRHRHDVLVRAWADVVGPDRVTVVVVDDADPRVLVGAFEQMSGLPAGSLDRGQETSNRSLTVPEVSMLRAFNDGWLAEGWSLADYTRFVRFASVRHLMQRKPPADEPRLRTPQWAVDRANEINREVTADIRASGVHVIGDLRLLEHPVLRSVGDNPATVLVPADVVAGLTAGLVKAMAETPAGPPRAARQLGPIEAALRRDKQERAALRTLAQIETEQRSKDVRVVSEMSVADVLRVIGGRVRRRVRRSVRPGAQPE